MKLALRATDRTLAFWHRFFGGPDDLASTPPTGAKLWSQRLLVWGIAWAAFVLGWWVVLAQNSLLWQRLPASTVERFVADHVTAPLPPLPKLEQLESVCAQPLSTEQRMIARLQRAALAKCLSQPQAIKQGAAAQAASQQYQALIEQQIQQAQAWLAAYPQQAPVARQALQAQLSVLQSRPAGSLTPLLVRLPQWLAPTSVREAFGPAVTVDTAQLDMSAKVARAQARLQALAPGQLPESDRLRELALLATGQQLGTDYGKAPPEYRLMSAPQTLAATLNSQRLQRNYLNRGMNLSRWQGLPSALALSAALVLLVTLLTHARLGPALTWVGVTHLLGAGALLLTDVALTGPGPMRYFVERQYFGFDVAGAQLPLTLALPGGVMLWLPLMLVALLLLALRGLRDGTSVWLAPVRSWLHSGSERTWGLSRLVVLLGIGGLCWLGLGMAAAVSELLIFLGCLGVASYLGRQAAHASAGAGIQWLSSLTVAGGLLAALGLSVARGDLGHALVALLLAVCFTWLFGAALLRWVMGVGVLLGAVGLGLSLLQGHLIWPLESLTHVLPAHAQGRVMAMFAPFEANSSDMARILWMMHSGGLNGWGLGYAPWLGLSGARAQDGLPLQGPSDYVLSLVSTVWGSAGGLWLMALVLAVFAIGAAVGLRTALRAGMAPVVRGLAALGGLGCVMMAGKVVLSVGGVGRVLPLTGLPVSLLGYGPMTHFAALLYLALALGTAHVTAAARTPGVRWAPNRPAASGVRHRASALAALGVVLLGLLLGGVALRNLRDAVGTDAATHLSHQRHAVATAVAQSLAPPEQGPLPATPPCPELGHAVAAWNAELGQLARPVRMRQAPNDTQAQTTTLTVSALRLDGATLVRQLEQITQTDHSLTLPTCKALARQLGEMLDTDLPRLVGRQTDVSDPNSPQALLRQAFDRPRLLGANALDFSTANAWWGVPGCVLPLSAQHDLPTACPAPSTLAAATTTSPVADVKHLLGDTWLQRQLAPQLALATRQPQGSKTLNHHKVTTGGVQGLSLDPKLQATAQRLVDCYTGHVRGADCARVLPRDAAWQARHFGGEDTLRAGAAGLVLAEVDSGRIMALAGALSDCSLRELTRDATPETGPDSKPRWPALRPEQRCAQLPDRRMLHAVGTEHPVLWRVPPGSTLKPLVVAAGIDAGLIAPAADAEWKSILAVSHERTPIQRIALASGQRFLDVLHGAGFEAPPLELLWGQGATRPKAVKPSGWLITAYDGTKALRPTKMTLEQSEAISNQKRQGLNADALNGPEVMTEFLAARNLADQALGASDIRMSTVGLLDIWRQLDLRARQQNASRPLHLLEQQAALPTSHSLEWLSPQAAQRVLGITSGVTSSALGGTAQGSCRVVFGACPAQGLPGVSGKTGTADFLTQDDGPYAKPGLQLPSKLFGGVFTAANGQRYAVAAITLRVRAEGTRTLEYGPSASAEAALTLMREMGVTNPSATTPR